MAYAVIRLDSIRLGCVVWNKDDPANDSRVKTKE